jgi:TonB family protein
MKNRIFSQFADPKKSTKRWLFFPFSLLIHGVIIVAVIVAPYLKADSDFPELKSYGIYIVSAPQEPLPPRAPSRPRIKPGKTTDGKKVERPKRAPSDDILVTPVTIPTEIEVDDIGDLIGIDDGSDDGVIGGVGNGSDDGVIGGVPWGSDPVPGKEELRISTVEIPKLIKKVTPNYPELAIRTRTQGNVTLEAVTNIYGKVIRINVLNGHPLLRKAAEDAVKKWIYEPYIINGHPKPVKFMVTVNFKLENAR